MDMEQTIIELAGRVEALEELVEELRYAGVRHEGEPLFTEDYDDYAAGEWTL